MDLVFLLRAAIGRNVHGYGQNVRTGFESLKYLSFLEIELPADTERVGRDWNSVFSSSGVNVQCIFVVIHVALSALWCSSSLS